MIFNIVNKIFLLSILMMSNVVTFTFRMNDYFDTKQVKEDAHLLVPELIKKYKYPVEIHHVTTQDGYILEIHRIERKGAEPFLLVHGLIDSSATFILMGPQQGLGYFLWEKGYDVWMGNCRGNRYSRNHTTMNPDNDVEFWNFSWHEIGLYDLPAMIDYILHNTKYDKLHYVGHSQGTTTFFVMGSRRPEYNNKVYLMHALSPVAYSNDIKSPFLFFLDYFLKSSISYLFHEFLPRYPVVDSFYFTNPIVKAVCIQIFYYIMGPNPSEYNQSLYSLIHSHMPAGSSIKQFRHYFQLINSGNFAEYDYGIVKNLQIYQCSEPPAYDLSKIKAPTILYYGENDYLSEPKNVFRLCKELPNVQGLYQINEKEFSHMDFCWAINARYLVYDQIIKNVNDYKKRQFKVSH